MRKTLLALGLAATVAAPSLAHASCHGRKVTGAVLGGLGGGAIGATASLPWGFAAAGMGALLGHAIADAGCHHHAWRHAYYRREHYRHAYARY